jgi:hypothetical protein
MTTRAGTTDRPPGGPDLEALATHARLDGAFGLPAAL